MRKRSLFVCGAALNMGHTIVALAPGGHQGTTGVQRASFFVSPHAHQASPCRQRAANTRVAGGNQHVEGVGSITLDANGKKIITNGFFWKDLPELESILQKHMENYYEMRYVMLLFLFCL